jgi:hypothetical protein
MAIDSKNIFFESYAHNFYKILEFLFGYYKLN